MKNKLIQILDVINIIDKYEIDEIIKCLSNLKINQSQNSIDINIELNKPISLDILEKLQKFNINNDYNIHFYLNLANELIDEYWLKIYISSYLNLCQDKFLLQRSFSRQTLKIIDNKIIIDFLTDNEKESWTKIESDLFLHLNSLINLNLNGFIFHKNVSYEQIMKQKDEDSHNQLIQSINQTINNTSDKKVYTNRYKANSSINDQPIDIDKISCDYQTVTILGQIFNLRTDKLSNGNYLSYFYVTDYTSSIIVKLYSSKLLDDPILKINNWVKMQINLERSFNDPTQINGKLLKWTLAKAKFEDRIDESKRKRIEFCLHSKMSAYDGLISVNDLYSKLEKYNHHRFAITDRYNVQAFPEIMKTFSKSEIKPIYGVELELIPSYNYAVLNPISAKLDDSTYVIFDIETTGLYANYNDIIEFGAVIVKNNKIVDQTQFFIKPTRPISSKTTELTGIKYEDVANGYDQKEGLLKIVDYLKDYVLVAHNGINFDFNFINTKLMQYGLKPLKNCMIDTLIISRSINPIYKSHTLEYICKKNKIEYDKLDAHRADYDANVLTYAWLVFVDKLKSAGIDNINQINDFIQSDSLNNSTFGNFVLVYAKNQNGIRDLYELVSLSCSQYFFNRPTLTLEILNKYHQNLLITNSPIESDLFIFALSKSDNEIIKIMNQYDFITIPSVNGFSHEINVGNISEDEVKSTISKIIQLAKQINKKVIAVSNAYYLDPIDKQYHDMYVNLPILNRKHHRYYKYGSGPDNFYRTTEEMLNEFEWLNDSNLVNEIVIDNTIEIANQIDIDIKPLKTKLYPPHIDGVNDKVTTTVYKNAHKIYGDKLPDIVERRLKKELDSIIDNGYAVVYWISHLLVEKSIKDGYVVGSRGSVGSSLVATFLNITDVNPLPPHYLCKKCQYSNFDVDKNIEDGYDLEYMSCPNCGNENLGGEGHNIPFETFLGFNGDKVPDIDLNFSGRYQAAAHNFIKEMFGENRTFRAGTISTIAEKTSFGNAKEYFELIQKEVSKAEIERYAYKCQDVKRTTGQHPGGIIVVPNDMSIFDFTPYNYPADDKSQNWFTTHFAFEYIHDNLLKFDILGHDNPTALRMLKDLTGVDEKNIPNKDPLTMSLFSSLDALKISSNDLLGEKTGAISLPEFGTKFVREMLNSTQPKTFSDLIRISGLSHGTDVWIGNAKTLISNGHRLKDIIGCRDDIMVYLLEHNIDPLICFQVMEDVRKGKQIKLEHQAILREHNVPEWYIESCNKIKYMFPKAHATAYVMHAWKFAWYKLYYPLEYYATYFSIRPDVFNIQIMCKGYNAIKEEYERITKALASPKLKSTIKTKEKDLLTVYEIGLEMYSRGYKFEMINLAKSDVTNFLINYENKSIICPFISMDGLGDQVGESIVNARNESPFISQDDFINRTKVTKQHIKSFIELGILDELSTTNQISLFEL